MRFSKYLRGVFIQRATPMRLMMHKALQEKQVRIVTPCIDLGGGCPEAQTYLEHIIGGANEKVLIADISKEADLYCNLEEPFPFEDQKFKTILLINVLPVIYDFKQVAKEMYRVLDAGGTAYIWTSFNANTHPHPNDYFRFTEQSLERIFKEAGFQNVEATPYGGLGLTIGAYTGQMMGGLWPLAAVIYFFALGLNKFLDVIRPGKNARKWPMGHLAIAKKDCNETEHLS